jgi:hypothetical protein
MTGTQLHQGRTTEENQYARVVPEDGNPVSLAAIADVYERRSSFEWRGLGEIDASGLKIRPEVRGVCEILGLDALYRANEGTLVLFVPEPEAAAALAAMQSTPAGTGARIIGRAVGQHPSLVTLRTLLCRTRIVDVLVGE